VNSIAFLEAFHPDGPWVLTAIKVDKKGITTRTFTPSKKSAAREWIKTRNKKENLYFSVNIPRTQVDKKTNREDIELMPYLHVDIDARAGEPLEKELERILKLITEDCPVVPPTFIVYSGGGYQAFWKLQQPIPIKGDLTAAEEAARYNKELEIILGGDGCHNIDRIMRLPGTMNIPDARKAAKGRVPVTAEVYSYRPENIYELSQFTQAPPLQTSGGDVNVQAMSRSAVQRLSGVEELDKWSVPDRVKVIIVQGFHPDEHKPDDNSRSAWLFDACCQLVRASVPDEVIFSIITDPDFGISASVLDKESNADRYATRQIERAKEEVEEPWLRKLNETFAVIGNLGGKCRVIEEVMDTGMERSVFTKQSFNDFRNRFANVFVTVGKRTLPVGQWWLTHPRRRQFDYLMFNPGCTNPNTYNLWQGFACKALPGTQHEPYLRHVHDNVCDRNDEYYSYLLGWMARTVQKPNSPGETAVVLRGKSGTGKSFFAKQFGSIWGKHFLQVSDAKHLVGSFNAHLRDCVILFGDEAFYAGDKKHESVLKTLITEERMIIEHKGVDAEVSPNFIHLILASNNEWVVPTGPTERRFFVLDVSDRHQQDNPYFAAIDKAMNNGGREALLYFLMTYDLSTYNVRSVPVTNALLEQKEHSLGPMHQWWLNRLIEGTLLSEQDCYVNTVSCDAIVADYVQACVRFSITHRGSAVRLGLFLNSVCPGMWPRRFRRVAGTSRKYYYKFPSLEQLRDRWDSIFGTKRDWNMEEAIVEEEEIPF
jgi:hypothetical protein